MTIAAIWQEDGWQWCAADTRLVAGDVPTTEIGTKIYTIPVVVRAADADGFFRKPHYWTQYGFVYAGAVLPAVMTAVTASTLLQNLVRPGSLTNPPTFEEITCVVHRLARTFMAERRQFGGDGLFSAALFGWCPHASKYKVAHLDGRDDAGSFRVELSYPDPPENDGDPWLVLGSGSKTFASTLAAHKQTSSPATKRIPRRVIDDMVASGGDTTVGGATSLGAAHRQGFELLFTCEPLTPGEPEARRIFNGLDLDMDVGSVGPYFISISGIA